MDFNFPTSKLKIQLILQNIKEESNVISAKVRVHGDARQRSCMVPINSLLTFK